VTTIDNGVLSVGTIGNGGVAGNLGQATATATNLVFDGGTLQYTGANATSNRAFTINAGKTATIDTTNDISFAGATGTTTTGALTKTGGGTLTLTGASTHTGATTVSAGTLALTNNSALQSSALNTSGAGSVTLGTGITTPTLGGLTGSTNLSSVITGNYSLVTALTLNPGVGQTHTYSGNITDGATGMTLTKTGAGTQVLAGTNTHTGRTTISAGTLALSGGNDRLATTGAITIGASGTLDLDGNTQTTTGAVTFTSGATLKGGTLTSNNTAIAGNNAITGTLNLGASGAFVTNQRLLLANGGTGSLTIGTGSTGSITFGGDNSTFQNYVGVGGGNGTLTVNGGTMNFNNASTPGTGNGYLNVGSNGNTSAGSIVVNGGNMNVGTWLKLGGSYHNGFGTNATSSLAIATGTVTVGGGSDASYNGVLFMNGGAGDNTANTGTSTLTLNNGGVLNVKRIEAGNQGTKTISFDGGTLRAGASSTTFLNAATGLTVNVKDGGATIDTQASDITVAAALVANGTGGLTKSGAGILTLSGTNTYTGDTTVSAGTLAVNGTSIADGGKLVIDGSGRVNLTGTEVVDSLYFDADLQSSGTWGSTSSSATHKDDTRFSGTGVLSVTTGTASDYNTWATTTYGLENPWLGVNSALNGTATADPDGDGLTNQQEYAFGLNPTIGSSVNPIIAPLNKATGQFTYTRRTQSLTTLVYTYEYSTTLDSWTAFTPAATSTNSGNPVEEITVTVPSAQLTNSKLFVRVTAN
jgi:autotransporter-associated beta strand protein